ncbi:visual perception [Sparganum proliferum]
MWTSSFLPRLLPVFGLLLLLRVEQSHQVALPQPDITWPDARDLKVILDPEPFYALRVQWQTQERDALRYLEVVLRCNDSDKTDRRTSTKESFIKYYTNPCPQSYVVEAFLQTAFNEKGMRVAKAMPESSIDLVVQPPTDAKASLFVHPNQSVSLNISFVPPSSEEASVDNITLVVTSANTSSEIYRETLKKGSHFTEVNQTVGLMQMKLLPVFKLGETYKLEMYTNDAKDSKSEAKIIMPDFDPRRIASAKATAASATAIDFEWGETVYPIDGLKSFLLRGVNGNGEASVEINSKERRSRLTNLKPFTNYTTSVISLYSDANTTTDTGVVLTWSAAPSPPTLTSAVASGPQSIKLSWTAPEITNGILGDYTAGCYRKGSDYLEGSRRVNAQTLSAEIIHLSTNTLFECVVIASTQEISWNKGGGKTSSARSSPVRTWPGTTEQPIIKKAEVLGPDSVVLEWDRANNVYGILGHYRVNCSQDGQRDNVKSVQVSNDTLRTTFSGLLPNTKYILTLEAFVLPNEQNLGGGYSQPSLEKTLTTWPDVPTEPTEVTVTAVSSTAVRVDWKAPLTQNGNISKYRVIVYEGEQNRSYETGPDALSYVFDGLQPYTTVALAVQAYAKPNSDGLGGGFGKVSPAVSVTTKEAAPGPVDGLVCTQTPLGSPRLACSWNTPRLPNGVIRMYTAQLKDTTLDLSVKSVETKETSVTFEEQLDFTHSHEVIVAAVTVTEGEQTDFKVQLQSSKLPEDSVAQLTSRLISPEFVKPASDPSTQVPLFLNLDDISFAEYSPVTAISVVVSERQKASTNRAVNKQLEGTTYYDHIYNGAQSWEVLVRESSGKVSQAIPNTHFVLGVDGGTIRQDHSFNGPLKPKTTYDVSVRVYTKAGYVETKTVEVQTEASTVPTTPETLKEEGFPPAAIAVTVCGILALAVLAIGISFVLVRRKRRNALRVDVDVENDDKSYSWT